MLPNDGWKPILPPASRPKPLAYVFGAVPLCGYQSYYWQFGAAYVLMSISPVPMLFDNYKAFYHESN